MTDPYLDLESARWARARDDYRAGLSAAEVCARHGLARSTFHARAHAERWRRCDLAASADALAPPAVDDFDPAAAGRSAFEMADLALRRLSHAVDKGRLREALGWARLVKQMRELTPEEEEGRSWRMMRREALAAAAAERAAASAAAVKAVAEPSPGRASVAPTTFSRSYATADRAVTLDTDGSVVVRDSFVGGESETASPARNGAQTAESIAETPLTLDSPDTYDTFDAVLPPELFAELVSDMAALRAGDPAHADDWAAWEGLQRKLVAARPDLSWWRWPSDEDDGDGCEDRQAASAATRPAQAGDAVDAAAASTGAPAGAPGGRGFSLGAVSCISAPSCDPGLGPLAGGLPQRQGKSVGGVASPAPHHGS